MRIEPKPARPQPAHLNSWKRTRNSLSLLCLVSYTFVMCPSGWPPEAYSKVLLAPSHSGHRAITFPCLLMIAMPKRAPNFQPQRTPMPQSSITRLRPSVERNKLSWPQVVTRESHKSRPLLCESALEVRPRAHLHCDTGGRGEIFGESGMTQEPARPAHQQFPWKV